MQTGNESIVPTLPSAYQHSPHKARANTHLGMQWLLTAQCHAQGSEGDVTIKQYTNDKNFD